MKIAMAPADNATLIFLRNGVFILISPFKDRSYYWLSGPGFCCLQQLFFLGTLVGGAFSQLSVGITHWLGDIFPAEKQTAFDDRTNEVARLRAMRLAKGPVQIRYVKGQNELDSLIERLGAASHVSTGETRSRAGGIVLANFSSAGDAVALGGGSATGSIRQEPGETCTPYRAKVRSRNSALRDIDPGAVPPDRVYDREHTGDAREREEPRTCESS